MSETRLGISITAKDTANEQIKALESSLKTLNKALGDAYNSAQRMGASSSGVTRALETEKAAILGQINALRETVSAANAAEGAIRRVGNASAAAARQHEEAAAGLGRIQPRRFISLADEFARGQRGQMFATMGAALKDIGVSGAVAATSIGAIVALMAGRAIEHGAESFGKWAEQVKAASMATGLSIPQYSALQGALVLTGNTAESADAALRMLATNMEKAAANPASRAAKAFQALGISLNEVKHSDVQSMLLRIADANQRFADGANKAAADEALMGRSLEHLGTVLDGGSAKIKELETSAKQTGLTLTNETDQSLITTNEAIEKLAHAIRGDAIQAFVDWGPAIIKITELLGYVGKAASVAANAISTAASVIMHPLAAFEAAGKLYAEGMGLGPGPATHPGAADITLPDVVVHPKPQVPAFDVPKPPHPKGAGAGPAHEYQDVLAQTREEISLLQRRYQLQSELASAQFEGQRISARTQQADRNISPEQRAQLDYQAYKAAGEQKLAALQTFQTAQDAAYEKLIAEALKVYGQDRAQYARAVGEKEAADQEFLVKHQEIINQINAHAEEIVTAHAQAVKQVIDQWGEAFDKMGEQVETSIGEAIKSAIEPMKPQYWYSSLQGPHGQPLIQAHRINPAMQIAGQLGENLLGDVGKQLQTSIMSSLAKSIFGAGTESFGQGIAKMIGIGTPGGLFGTGLGAVSQASTQATFAASVGTFAAAVGTFAAAAGTSAASSATSAVGGIGSAAGAAGGIGSLFSTIGSFFGFSSGGIVPSAAGGWALGHFPGATPALLHANEMVLPEHLSTGIQGMINRGGANGGDMHMHFHGPADAPSIAKWFSANFRQNSAQIRQMFRQNSLTPRSI